MADLPGTARVVIIGGGAVGTSSLYHLAKAGWTDCVLLEKNELTAGSTWHAAGNCPNFSTSWAVLNMQRYSLEMYRTLAEDVVYPMNYHVTGSLRLGHTKERAQEFQRVLGMAQYQGIDMAMVSNDEAREMYPFLETHDLSAILYDPYDGDIDPAQLTQAMAKGARDLGARIVRFCPATGVRRENGEWIVETEQGEIRCEYVVNAAGYYAQRVGEWFKPHGGRTVPMVVLSHQYFLTEEIPAVAEWTRANGRKLPLVRDVDSSYYLRQDKTGLNLGPYERNCRAHWVTPDDPMPEDFSFQLYPDDLDRLEWYIEDAMARVPVLGEGGVGRNINGPIPYAPDGMPMIGPMPGVVNAFEAHSFTFGIVQAGGAGKVLAEWIIEGATEWDMWTCDPRRYTDFTDQAYCLDKALETYGHEYGMHFPWKSWPAGRDRRLSPVDARVRGMGGQMGAYAGWERANWFAAPGDDTSLEASQTWDRAGPWEARVRAECEAVRDGVGVLDLPGFSRFKLEGARAAEWLRGRIAGSLPKVGRLNLAYFPDARGRILTEMSVIRHGEEDVTLLTAAASQWHEHEMLWRAGLPEGVSLTDHTAEYSTLIVTGPKSRALFEALETEADLALPWLSHQAARVAGVDCMLVRVSCAGELCWEFHAAIADIPALYDAVLAAGATPFGMWALNSLRIEKGYRAWKGDLSTDYSLLEGGLERFVKFDKPQDFPGKAALLAEKQRGVAKRFAVLKVDAGAADAPAMSTIVKDGAVVGETTSGAWGYRVGHSVALAMVQADLAAPGTALEVNIFGDMCRAEVLGDGPVWDAGNERLRA